MENLYRNQIILLFKEVYALEKIHGTSAHVGYRGGQLHFPPGGECAVDFAALFDFAALRELFAHKGHNNVTIYGEAYGGVQQKQAWRYGDKLRFAVFEVRVGEQWLSVPQAEKFATDLGLEFVPYKRISTDLASLDAAMSEPSEQARRNGMGTQPREGVVLRPLYEFTGPDGARIIAKHKRPEERETAHVRAIVDPALLTVLTDAGDIAFEWVTDTRLEHVLAKINAPDIRATKAVITAMVEDVYREGKGELVEGKEVEVAIGKRTAQLFHARLRNSLRE